MLKRKKRKRGRRNGDNELKGKWKREIKGKNKAEEGDNG
jgi:hypothetical protein